jgi:5-methylcytosine-specific restriction endonuclease McrA
VKPRRRVFGRGYGPRSPSGRYSYRHRVLAREITRDAACAFADRGGCDGPIEADHIVPRDWGGESSRENLRPLCRRHNRRRGIETKKQKLK